MMGEFLRRIIDDQITKQLRPYLAIGYDKEGKPYSDVVVTERSIAIVNMFARLEKMNDLIGGKGLPFNVQMLHIKKLEIKMPEKWKTGLFEFNVDELMVVLERTDRAEWSVDHVRALKEAKIEAALLDLIKKTQASVQKKDGIVDRLKKQFMTSCRIQFNINNVHAAVALRGMGRRVLLGGAAARPPFPAQLGRIGQPLRRESALPSQQQLGSDSAPVGHARRLLRRWVHRE